MSKGMSVNQAEFDRKVSDMDVVLAGFPWDNTEAYTNWLAQTYYLVRHSTRFISLAAGLTPVEDRDGHYGMIHHLKGETNHDLLVLRDLKELGRSIDEFSESPATRLIVHNQYYWITNGHPLSMCGYALMLEGLSVKSGPGALAKIAKSPHKKANSFLKVHVEVDQDHYAEGLGVLEGLPSNVMEQIRKNFEESGLLYARLLEECAAKGNAHVAPMKSAGRKAA